MLTPLEKHEGHCVRCGQPVIGYTVKAPNRERFFICREHFFDRVDELFAEKETSTNGTAATKASKPTVTSHDSPPRS